MASVVERIEALKARIGSGARKKGKPTDDEVELYTQLVQRRRQVEASGVFAGHFQQSWRNTEDGKREKNLADRIRYHRDEGYRSAKIDQVKRRTQQVLATQKQRELMPLPQTIRITVESGDRKGTAATTITTSHEMKRKPTTHMDVDQTAGEMVVQVKSATTLPTTKKRKLDEKDLALPTEKRCKTVGECSRQRWRVT